MAEELIERSMPSDLEAEIATLGSIILDSERMIEVREFVSTDDFYKYSHRIIFQAMMDLSDRREPVEAITLINQLKQSGQLEEIGGVSAVTDLVATLPGTAANAVYYAKIVEEKSLSRKLIRALTETTTKVYDGEGKIDDLISDTEAKLLSINDKRNGAGFRAISDILNLNFDEIERLSRQNDTITGIATGYRDLDKMTTGLHEEELIILAARPAVGKTAFALNIAQNIATKQDRTVAIFSLEMGAESLVNRMIAAEGSIDAYALRTGSLTEEQWQSLTVAMGTLSRASIYIDDTPGIKITEIRSKAHKLAQQTGNLGLILIDYLQLISGTGRENRQQEVSEISRQLKILAKELKVPVMALSQLSRGVEQRQDKRPVLSDIRESGSIEQDADIVAFLYREDYYRGEDGEEPIPNDTVEVIIEKNRSGSRGTVELLFKKEFNKFTNISKREA
ncbi:MULTISPECIES: replicative DNA helicase [unclassified Enterococcus]|uniref:replicative DNA helicase n=1 Tax=unclassified Enterococcus TaxID=2608891 RepID=UPI0015575CA4|nr:MULTISPECIES: replicative DNA helicase [unclassified Enterococcus]MBS7576193.1 replicative DNA helicase [Enterococcus sp. MMGLQ5-2]MBS7583426.1 replicative DNA helicase [Enterococcus sp. MMGLQ5-1]NPD11286.1 replicative DNA helicase [Enterococcus sp. MMGLQ5-1]NPD36029.1 replicative DNA helicase [Enterococcus sp. MMGLQ5-2]